MKYIILIILFAPFLLRGQTAEEKLKQAWGYEKYSEYKNNFPDSIEYYKFIIENGYRISKLAYVSLENIAEVKEIMIPDDWIENGNIDFSKFNILKLGLPLNSDNDSYYTIKGTDYVLIIRSRNYLEKKYKTRK